MSRIAVRAIIVHENKLLLVKLKSYNGTRHNFYCTVGGGLEEDEPLIEGLKREILEETGVTAQVGRLLFIQQFTDKQDQHHLEFFFEVINGADFATIDLEQTTHGVEEIEEIGFYDHTTVPIKPQFIGGIDLKTLAQVSSVKIYDYLKPNL